MKQINYIKSHNRGFGRIGLVLVLPFILLVAAYVIYRLFFMTDPVINGIDAFNFLPLEETVNLECENVKSINITAYQAGNKIEIFSDKPDTAGKTYSINVKPKELGLADGPAIVTVTARAGFLKKVKHDIKSIIDTEPPTVQVLRAPYLAEQGGAGFAVLMAKDADSVFIKLGERKFRAYAASSTETASQRVNEDIRTDVTGAPAAQASSGKNTSLKYYAFFPVPLDVEEGNVFYAVAEDTAGNQAIRALSTKLKAKRYKESSITIDDSFINMVVLPLLNITQTDDPAASFKKVNEDWRAKNLESLFDISMKSEPEILWKDSFIQLKNSKVMAVYGDKRTYYYSGNPVSESLHLGYDLASFSNAPVEAANSGIVKFAGNLGIYGNTVIIDHGIGLMSLYGHLSAMTVTEGQTVERGDVIAATGATGLAGGDHLHFGILVQGYEVSPIYWWDRNWIKVNITDYLN